MCRVSPGQPVRGKLADQEVSGMIRAVATPAPETFNRIKNTYNQVKGQFEQDLASIGVEIEPKMVKGKNSVILEISEWIYLPLFWI